MAVSINNLSNASYIEQAPAIVVDSDITFSGGANYSVGSLEFSLNTVTSSDFLTLINDASVSTANNAISIVGNTIYLGDGTSAAVVGSVDSTLDGKNGQNLRINFSSGFPNGNFDLGSPGSTTITSWTTVNQQVKFGVDQIAGLATPVDATMPANARNSDRNTPTTLGSLTTALSPIQNDGSGNSVRLTSSGMTTAQGYDVVRGPYIYSNGTASLSAGDQVSFEWQAQGGGDAYDVYGYIVDVNTGHIETLLNETGNSTSASTTWATKAITVSQAGEYRFVFVSGTYDFSGGRAAGAQLFIDDVTVSQVVPTTVLDDNQVSYIAQRIQYNNTSDNPDPSKTLTVSLQNNTGNVASATATINITPIDDPATIGGNRTGTGGQGVPITGTLTATDPEGLTDGTIFSIESGSQPANGTASINPASGAWTYTSSGSFSGNDAFTVTVTDDKGGTTTQSINLIVQDVQAPVLQSAVLNGTSLVLTYNEALDGASDPVASAFTVNANGSPVTVNGVNADGPTVTLTLANTLASSDILTVDYAVPASNPVQDGAGNDAAAFSNVSVTNNNDILIAEDSLPLVFSTVERAKFLGKAGTELSAFDESFYLSHNPDVASAVSAGIFKSGFEHFTAFGQAEGRTSNANSAIFDEGYYLFHNPDVASAVSAGVFKSGLEHFNQFGQFEGRNPSILYDESFYLSKNPDVANAVASGIFKSGFQHFSQFGELEGRDPSPSFTNSLYLSENPDVGAAVSAGAFGSGFAHFIQFGEKEGRDDNLLFSERYYLSQNSDVASAVASGAFKSGFDHFIQFGQTEGRAPSELYNESYYLTQNADVAAAVAGGAYKSGFDHFVQFGEKEGRFTVAPVGLDGGDGDDIIYGGVGGRVVMTGGQGSDRFWVADQVMPRTANTVTDFEAGVDAIVINGLPGVTGIGDLNISQQGADTSVSALGKELATLVGVQATNLNSNSFIFSATSPVV
jgi:plastocyanin